MKQVLTLLVLCCPLFAQESSHPFLDKTASFTLGASATLYSADAAITCHKLSPRWNEHVLPTQSCAGVAGFLGGEFAAQTSAAYFLHRRGHHHLERLVEMFSASGSGVGIVLNLRARPRPLPPIPPAPAEAPVFGIPCGTGCIP